MSTFYRPPDQRLHPYHFGDPYTKTTCLWLKNLNKLVARHIEAPLFGEHVDKGEFYISPHGKKLPSWYGDTIVDGKKIGYNTDLIKRIRSKTFQGFADAMASQWG